jgi:hypothetical protein
MDANIKFLKNTGGPERGENVLIGL